MEKGDYTKLHSGLVRAVERTPGIHAAGAPVIESVDRFGRLCWRELAFRIYDLADQQGVLDRVFPAAIKEDGSDNAQARGE